MIRWKIVENILQENRRKIWQEKSRKCLVGKQQETLVGKQQERFGRKMVRNIWQENRKNQFPMIFFGRILVKSSLFIFYVSYEHSYESISQKISYEIPTNMNFIWDISYEFFSYEKQQAIVSYQFSMFFAVRNRMFSLQCIYMKKCSQKHKH